MFNGFAIALASEGHLRYFKAQKPSEGNRFHKPDSQFPTERHQIPTHLPKMLDPPAPTGPPGCGGLGSMLIGL